MIDHCAKNATPKIVNIVERNNNNSDWSTPQITIKKIVSIVTNKAPTILLVIFTLPV